MGPGASCPDTIDILYFVNFQRHLHLNSTKYPMERAHLTFQRERSQDIFDEILPLAVEHFKEVAPDNSMPVDPNWDAYDKLEDSGNSRTFTVRDPDGTLIGYAVFFVWLHQHSKNSLQAVSDIIYLRPDRRGPGGEFLSWCENELILEGVDIIYMHTSNKNKLCKMVERKGYELVDLVYSKRVS